MLVIGAVLAPGERTVAAMLRVTGLSNEKHYQNYHRVLNRAKWSSRAVSRVLMLLLVAAFVAAGNPVVVGIDETIERRRGRKISARGIYREKVAFEQGVLCQNQWAAALISMMLLVPMPWANRIWGLPFLNVLAPSERYHERCGKRHKTITDWARQMIGQLHRWLPNRSLVIVGDGAYAAVKFLCAVVRWPGITVVTRMRLDAALYDPPPVREAGKKGRPALKGKRQPSLSQRLNDPATEWQKSKVLWYGDVSREVELATGTALWYHPGVPPVALRWVLVRDPEGQFASQALLCTNQSAQAIQILEWFVMRWSMEVTFHEVRTHLGVETQRQWSDLAILRTTPALLGLFSLVTLFTHHLLDGQPLPVRQAAWYAKALPTFSDTLAYVRQRLWPSPFFCMSSSQADTVQIPRALFDLLVDTLAFTA